LHISIFVSRLVDKKNSLPSHHFEYPITSVTPANMEDKQHLKFP